MIIYRKSNMMGQNEVICMKKSNNRVNYNGSLECLNYDCVWDKEV